MAVRVQMDQVKFQEFIFEYLEPMTNSSTTYMLIQSAIEQLPLVVTQCYFTLLVPVDMPNCALKLPLYSNFALPRQCEIMKYSSIGINHIPCCYGNLVAMVTRGKP